MKNKFCLLRFFSLNIPWLGSVGTSTLGQPENSFAT
uniref:Uncharacterized protein n=1 Tax=Setaria viridis TaxID=4556 RepID=A0A4U6URA6_SETVI|nr:hypothetical protein SEVIR_5G473950v2 [Setaria viridis]